MARVCVFCGGRKITAEHGWPAWLENVLPGKKLRQSFIADDFIPTQRGERTSVAGNRVRRVCKSCNGGWMSGIENVAKPIVGPMVRGLTTKLTKQDQHVLAIWIIKTALVLPLSGHERSWRPFSSAYKEFFKRPAPSKKHHVFVAAFSGQKWTTGYHQQPLAATLPGKPQVTNAYFTSILVGHLIGQVFYAPSDMEFRAAGTASRLIWPYGGDFFWPSGPPVSPDQFQGMATLPNFPWTEPERVRPLNWKDVT